MSRDRAWLLAALRRGALAGPPPGGDVANLAAREGVSGLLARAHPALLEAALSIRFEAIRVGAFSARVVRVLAEAGLEALLLKGSAIAALAWDEPSNRPQSDVDVLVRPEAMDKAARALSEAGLTRADHAAWPSHHHEVLMPADEAGCVVELHRDLSTDLPLQVRFEELWERRQVAVTAEGDLPTLGLEDTLVYLALHAAIHALERLSWLVDIAGLARRTAPDWDLAAARARTWGAARAVAIAWQAAREDLDAPIPAQALAQLGGQGLRFTLSRALLGAAVALPQAARKPVAVAYRFSLVETAGLPATLRRKLRQRGEGKG